MPPEPRNPLALLIGAAASIGCGSPDCATVPPGMDQDLCWFEASRAEPEPDAAALAALARKIQDPVVRSATVMHWVRRHPEADGSVASLCELLAYSEQISCRRRLESPHLRR